MLPEQSFCITKAILSNVLEQMLRVKKLAQKNIVRTKTIGTKNVSNKSHFVKCFRTNDAC
jgi:hypothetical protein